ncbi:MAG: inorganic diphosphatase [Phycisphaeraceae bacterium]|nr:inorganic diphosphatase [Phycisphaeraceae bacterium]
MPLNFDSKWYEKIPSGPNPPQVINVIVEIAKGRRTKVEVDKATGMLKMDRYLYSSAMYPGDYGFVPQTLAEDGDPLDVLVMVNEPMFSGCLIEARPIGLFKMMDKGANDFKILAVPNSDPIFAEYHDLWRVPPHFLREVEHFFATYKDLEGGVVKTLGWDDADKACDEIRESMDRFLKRHGKAIRPKGKAKPRSRRAKR